MIHTFFMIFRSREQSCEVVTDDMVSFSWIGIVDPEDVTVLFRQVREHCRTWSRMFWLWDMTTTQLLPRGTRSRLLEEALSMPLEGTATVVSEFQIRIPVTMLLEVVAIDATRRPPYRFFDTRQAAAAWIQTLRGVSAEMASNRRG